MKVRVAGSDEYISLSRARWLVSARRARFLQPGELQILYGPAHATDPGERVRDAHIVRWSAYSNLGLPNPAGMPWLRGVRMNGAALHTDDC